MNVRWFVFLPLFMTSCAAAQEDTLRFLFITTCVEESSESKETTETS